MKKKVALLLVLSMLMSMLPMNVFGAPSAGWLAPGASVTGRLTNGGENNEPQNLDSQTNITVHLPLAAFAGMQTPLQLNVRLDNAYVAADHPAGDSTHRPNRPDGTPWGFSVGWGSVFNPPAPIDLGARVATTGALVAGFNPANVNVELTGAEHNWHSWGIAMVRLSYNSPIPAGVAGTISFDLPIRGWGDWQNATLTVNSAPDAGGTPFITNWPLVGAGTRSVAWSVTGGPRGFSSALHVPPLRISENQFGTLDNVAGTDTMVVMLTAPQFYTWSFMPPAGTVASQDIVSGRPGAVNPLEIRAGGVASGASFTGTTAVTGIGGSNQLIGVGPNVWGTRTGTQGIATGQHRIYIPMQNFSRNTAWSPGTGWIELRNLWLVPDANAPATGEVNIAAQVGRMAFTGVGNITGPQTGTTQVLVPAGGTVPANAVSHTPGTIVAVNTWVTVNEFAQGTLNVGQTPSNLNWLTTGFNNQLVVNDGQRVGSLHVGNRGTAALSVEVHNGPNDIRTGHLGVFRPANFVHSRGTNGRPPETPASAFAAGEGWRWNRDNEGLPYHEGVMTSTLIIEENIAGGFTFGFGAPINFEFLDDEGNPHPGIRILGMEARAGNFRHHGWTRGEMNNFWGGNQAIMNPDWLPGQGNAQVGGVDAWEGANQNWMTFRGWVSALDQRLPNVAGVGRLSDTQATVYLPSQTISDVNPMHTAHHGNGILEVRFFLSVEAGFEWKYGSNIDVSISGSGVTNLVGAEGAYTTTIAHARDPIAMTLATGSTPVETGTLYNIQGGVQSVSDVVIDVVDNAAFGVGEELWIYLGTDTIGRNFDVNLVNVPTVHVNPESGLRLDSGRLMAPAAAGHVGRAGVAFTVTRQPYGGDSPAPVITLSNINVEGQAFPGIEYQVIVSGTGVANNDQEVFQALRQTVVGANLRNHVTLGDLGQAHGAFLPTMSRGVFTSLPFNATVLENIFGGVWDTAPDAGLPTGGLPTGEFRMWEGMGPVAGVDEPFRWVNTPGTRLRVGFVSARAFAYFINGSPDQGVDWNASTNTATISGTDTNNNPVTVVMTVGSNFANVNGQPHDIANFAGQSGPDGSIQVVPTPDGRIFLPLRFLANAFGRTVHAEGEVVVFR